jgi:hypothetical protein
MSHSSLQDVLSKVGEDDLTRAAKKAEEERAGWKALRAQTPNAGLTAGELVEQLSAGEEEETGKKEILTLKPQEKKDVPKTQRAGFFPPPPGK